MIAWSKRRRTERNAQQQLAVLWALRACDGQVTATEVAKLVDLSASAVLSHLQILEGCGCVSVSRTPPSDGSRPRAMWSLAPSGQVYIANLVEGLLATAKPWGGAGFQRPGRGVGPV